MKNIFTIIIFILIGYFVYRIILKYPYRYVGYFYPNVENMNKRVESEPLNSLDACRQWVNKMINKYKIYDKKNYDYECGKDCYKSNPYNQGITYTCNTSVK